MSSAPSSSYRRLALATGVATFLLIIVGGIVRVSDSGLGCGPGGSGFHGWPFCNGDVVPGLDLNHIIEYTHRALAGVVGILIVALAVQAWRHHRANRALVWVTTRARAARVRPGGARRATVEENLEEALVAAHLGLAMLLLGGLLWVWRATRPGRGRGGARRRRPRLPRAGRGHHRGRALHDRGRRLHGRRRRSTGARTTSWATARTMPAARSSPPATATSCPSVRRASWTST